MIVKFTFFNFNITKRYNFFINLLSMVKNIYTYTDRLWLLKSVFHNKHHDWNVNPYLKIPIVANNIFFRCTWLITSIPSEILILWKHCILYIIYVNVLLKKTFDITTVIFVKNTASPKLIFFFCIFMRISVWNIAF